MREWTPIRDLRRGDVTDERLERGPRWAADYIRLLERELHNAREAADQASLGFLEGKPTGVTVRRLIGPEVEFPRDATVTFRTRDADPESPNVPDWTEGRLTCHVEEWSKGERALIVRSTGGGTLDISPQSGNVVAIRVNRMR